MGGELAGGDHRVGGGVAQDVGEPGGGVGGVEGEVGGAGADRREGGGGEVSAAGQAHGDERAVGVGEAAGEAAGVLVEVPVGPRAVVVGDGVTVAVDRDLGGEGVDDGAGAAPSRRCRSSVAAAVGVRRGATPTNRCAAVGSAQAAAQQPARSGRSTLRSRRVRTGPSRTRPVPPTPPPPATRRHGCRTTTTTRGSPTPHRSRRSVAGDSNNWNVTWNNGLRDRSRCGANSSTSFSNGTSAWA